MTRACAAGLSTGLPCLAFPPDNDTCVRGRKLRMSGGSPPPPVAPARGLVVVVWWLLLYVLYGQCSCEVLLLCSGCCSVVVGCGCAAAVIGVVAAAVIDMRIIFRGVLIHRSTLGCFLGR